MYTNCNSDSFILHCERLEACDLVIITEGLDRKVEVAGRHFGIFRAPLHKPMQSDSLGHFFWYFLQTQPHSRIVLCFALVNVNLFFLPFSYQSQANSIATAPSIQVERRSFALAGFGSRTRQLE